MKPIQDVEQQTGAVAAAQALVAEGVTTVFGLIGDGNLLLIAALVDAGVRFVPARHEQGAVAMADGFSRASGGLGVASVTQGPGVTHALTALHTAAKGNSRVVLLTGETPPGARLHPQRLEQAPLVQAVGVRYVAVRTRQTVLEDIRLGLRHVYGLSEPVVIGFRTDLQLASAEVSDPMPARASLGAPAVPRADPSAVSSLADRLESSERPVLVAGRGAVDARTELIELADRVGALLGTTLPAKGLFAGHPSDLGIVGGFSHEVAASLLGRADLVVALGASLNRFTTKNGRLFDQAGIAHVTMAADDIGDPMPVDLAVLGDARSVVKALLGAEFSTQPRWGEEPQLAALPGHDPLADIPFAPEPLDPRRVVRLASQLLPQPRSVIAGVGQYAGWPAQLFDVEGGRSTFMPWDFGAVGIAVGVALGVAAARPTELTVGFVGDGGFMMSLADLDTAARMSLPVVFVVMDDGGFGAEVRLLAHHGLPRKLAHYDNPSLAQVARSLGLSAHEVWDESDLVTAFKDLGAKGAGLVHAHIDPRVTNHAMFAGLEG